jgi:hypothetical protein
MNDTAMDDTAMDDTAMDDTATGSGRKSNGGQQEEISPAAQAGPAGREGKDSKGEDSEGKAEGDDPVARSDRYTRTTVSREEWFRMLNQADPWDRRLKAQKDFERADSPVRSVKAYRQGTDYYLLNRGEKAIGRLRYRACEVDVNTRRAKQTQLYEIRGFPPKSYVKVGRMDLESQRRMAFWLALAEWEGGHCFEAEAGEEERRLRVFDHSDHVPTLDALDLSAAQFEPTIVGS